MPAVRNFNNVTTLGALTGPVSGAATTLVVTAFSQYPTTPFTVTVDRNTATEEVMLVTAVAGSTLTVTRGYDGTAGIGHLAGATVEHTAVALDFTEANVHHNATANVHGVTGDLVGAEGVQTILDKTFVGNVHQADATLGDAVVAVIPAGAGGRNLFRGVGLDGTDKYIVDANGALTAAGVTVTATLAAATSAATANALTKRDGSGTAAFARVTVTAGTPTTAGELTRKDYVDNTDLNRKTYVDNLDAARKTYVDGLATKTGSSRQLSAFLGSGTAWPASPIEGDTFRRTDLGYTGMFTAGVWLPITPVSGKAWRTAGNVAIGTGTATVALTASRLAGGVTFSANRLTLPLDGVYRVIGRGHMTGGTINGWNAAFQVVRQRSAAADKNIAYTGVRVKDQLEDMVLYATDLLPLQANDSLLLQVTVASGSGNHGGSDEANGPALYVEWAGPLNGATPI